MDSQSRAEKKKKEKPCASCPTKLTVHERKLARGQCSVRPLFHGFLLDTVTLGDCEESGNEDRSMLDRGSCQCETFQLFNEPSSNSMKAAALENYTVWP